MPESHRLLDGTVVLTDYDPPPIPARDFDYIAWHADGRSDGELCGRGRTRSEAIEDLLDRMDTEGLA